MNLNISKLRAWLSENLERDFASEARAEQMGLEGKELNHCCVLAKFLTEGEGYTYANCGYDNAVVEERGFPLRKVLDYPELKQFVMDFDVVADLACQDAFTGRQALEALDALSS